MKTMNTGVADDSHLRRNDDESAQTPPAYDKLDTTNELFSSVKYGMIHVVVDILKNHQDLANEIDVQGNTCMHWAARKGDREMLQILTNAGAAVDQPNVTESKMMPIHWAASDGKIASLRFLLERRVDINAQDANGCTPLVIAVQHNQLDCVVYLIKNGADTTLRDENGDSALHWAAYKGYVEMVGLLTFLIPHEIDTDDAFGQVVQTKSQRNIFQFE